MINLWIGLLQVDIIPNRNLLTLCAEDAWRKNISSDPKPKAFSSSEYPAWMCVDMRVKYVYSRDIPIWVSVASQIHPVDRAYILDTNILYEIGVGPGANGAHKKADEIRQNKIRKD